ncbi:MAG: transglycosylase domain-containing protein [Parcubacteria group bacterium]|nr:transglycosylase domain-containing protein [Parcubacteria group bacterium]
MSKRRVFKQRLVFFRIAGAMTLFAAFFVVIGVGMALKDLPDASSLQGRVIKQSTKIFDRTGEVLLYEIHGGERRTVLPFDEIPDIAKKATLVAEDANFYSHPAFDARAIARAIFHNIVSRGSSIQGGSTITQQLVKNSLLKPERTLKRKIKELVLAVKLEQLYSKDEILGLYLNQIPYGANAYGIEAASQTFFTKSARDLSLSEATLLAALPKAPSYFSPYGNHTDELRDRQLWILERMVRLGYISPEEGMRARETAIRFARQAYGIRAPHFVMYVRELLAEKYGEEMIESGGLKVITALDWKLQEIAEEAIQQGAEINKTAWQASNAALVAIDPKTGQILSMVGSRDYFELENEGNVNVTTRVRQPGSAFKPFAYLTAFRKGYTPETVMFDVPTEFNPNCSPEGTPPPGVEEDVCYHPSNYDEKFRGPVTMRQALAQSLNVPSVQVLYFAGLKDTLETARSFGITTLKEPPEYYGLPLVLGGGGVKLVELVGAFAAFSQEGTWRPQVSILRVEDALGKVLEEFHDEPSQVFEPQYVRILNDVLSDDAARVPAFQPNGLLTLPGRQVAAKTGTSQDYRDAWTVGYTPSLAVGVWVGNNNNSPMIKGGAGVMAAAPIWNTFILKASLETPQESFVKPDTISVSKPILRGEYLPGGGGTGVHSTLFWVEKDNPQGPQPSDPSHDPQFANWETGVQKWFSANVLEAASSLGLPNIPSLTITEPKNDARLPNREVRVTASVRSSNSLKEIVVLWNDKEVVGLNPTPENIYSVYFVPSVWKESNEIRFRVRDSMGNVGTQAVVVHP